MALIFIIPVYGKVLMMLCSYKVSAVIGHAQERIQGRVAQHYCSIMKMNILYNQTAHKAVSRGQTAIFYRALITCSISAL